MVGDADGIVAFVSNDETGASEPTAADIVVSVEPGAVSVTSGVGESEAGLEVGGDPTETAKDGAMASSSKSRRGVALGAALSVVAAAVVVDCTSSPDTPSSDGLEEMAKSCALDDDGVTVCPEGEMTTVLDMTTVLTVPSSAARA